MLQHYPSSSKAAASMLKAGYAYSAAGDKKEAKARLIQVVNLSKYPSAQLANSKLKQIN